MPTASKNLFSGAPREVHFCSFLYLSPPNQTPMLLYTSTEGNFLLLFCADWGCQLQLCKISLDLQSGNKIKPVPNNAAQPNTPCRSTSLISFHLCIPHNATIFAVSTGHDRPLSLTCCPASYILQASLALHTALFAYNIHSMLCI